MPAVNPTPTQLAYLDFIRKYIELHRRSPAEHEMQGFFGTTPPAVHQMVVTLTKKGLITRAPGVARSIRLVTGLGAPALPDDVEDDDWQPTRPPDHITEPIDRPILPLVEALRADPRVRTRMSCWGHGKKPAYVDLAVEGTEGLRVFVEKINVVDSADPARGAHRRNPQLERGGRDRVCFRPLPELDHALVAY